MIRLVRGFRFSSGNSITSFKLTVPDWSVSSFLNLRKVYSDKLHINQASIKNTEFYLLDNLEISAPVKFVAGESWEAVLPILD